MPPPRRRKRECPQPWSIIAATPPQPASERSGNAEGRFPDFACAQLGYTLQFPSSGKDSRSRLLNALEGARIGRLFQVGLGIVCPKLRYVWIGFDRHVPVFAVGALDDAADVDVVDRVAVGVEAHRLSDRGIRKLGLADAVDEGVAVLHPAADLFDGAGDPHRTRIHGEAEQRGDLAVLRAVVLDELYRHRIVRTFDEMRR